MAQASAPAAPPAAGRRIKTIQQYFEEPFTPNQKGFLDFVLDNVDIKFKNKGEEQAFAQGVKAAGLYARYQDYKRQQTRRAAEAAPKSARVQPRRSAPNKAAAKPPEQPEAAAKSAVDEQQPEVPASSSAA